MAARLPLAASIAAGILLNLQPLPAEAAESPLHLAWLGPDRLIALFPRSVVLYRAEGTRFDALAEAELPCRPGRVRTPGGLLLASAPESSFWAMTSFTRGAVLFGVDGDRLQFRDEVAALPWPGSRAGLRFRLGTNVLEGSLAGHASESFLAVARDGDRTLALSPDGRLLVPEGEPGARVGSALAVLWPGLLAASSSTPPGEADAVLILSVTGTATPLATTPVAGAVRALAAQVQGDRARLAVAAEDAGGTRLVRLDLERPRP